GLTGNRGGAGTGPEASEREDASAVGEAAHLVADVLVADLVVQQGALGRAPGADVRVRSAVRKQDRRRGIGVPDDDAVRGFRVTAGRRVDTGRPGRVVLVRHGLTRVELQAPRVRAVGELEQLELRNERRRGGPFVVEIVDGRVSSVAERVDVGLELAERS